jgi:cystinosin
MASFLCWSISFYPQPLLNWRRRSTHGLAIEYPLMNLLGFTSYTISTGAFFFSPLIKSQYAYRHPDSPETTVRFNDFAFAAHALVLCVITYSQFLPKLWGFDESARQRPNRVVLGVFWGSILGVLVLILLVRIRGDDGGMDPSGWAWIDVVGFSANNFLFWPLIWTDLRLRLHQTARDGHQVHATGLLQLQAQVDRWMGNRSGSS